MTSSPEAPRSARAGGLPLLTYNDLPIDGYAEGGEGVPPQVPSSKPFVRWLGRVLIGVVLVITLTNIWMGETQDQWNAFGMQNCTREEGVVVILSHHSMRSEEREFITSREERLGCVSLDHIRIPIDQEVK